MEAYAYSLNELPTVVTELLDKYKGQAIWLLEGDLGAGKTTLIKEVCSQYKVTETVNSPTFSLVNEYTSPQGPLYHFDLYRLTTEEEGWEIGIEEYLESGHLCLIEWPEKMNPVYEWPHILLQITVVDAENRTLNITRHD